MKNNNVSFGRLVLVFVLVGIIPAILFLTSCSTTSIQIESTDLMKGMTPVVTDGKETDSIFIERNMDFSLDLLKGSLKDDKNTLLSPLSVMLALSMTANGAENNTLSQMEEVLGQDLTIQVLNEYLHTYTNNLPSKDKSKLSIANSIWFRDDEDRLHVEDEFLQTNADYYGASAYKSAFDEQTLTDINHWVKNKTDGLIEKIIDQIDEDTVMYLINAMVFDGEWKNIYREEQLSTGIFTASDSKEQNASYMTSEENIFLSDGSSTGFIKPYVDEDYSFFAILPNENTTVEKYLNGLDSQSLLNMFDNKEDTLVTATTPKFKFEYELKMNDLLKSLGMTDAFDPKVADLSKLGRSSRGNLFIGDVIHKTFISVDEKGTKAGAVTKVEVKDESYVETKTVKLDRPFIFGILDNRTDLPLFIGVLNKLD
ncbi:serpin family protein [Alkalibacter mobilis]|uniref:serpin family protein n=1 Tax=Alkalibacter mobilis TaxID=2787712 RepID=UPI00189D89F4|nr:serpin family protein [Alkalibacter mobilis]MBF7095561.1 serpin family protein [Alkalibacter mobilis]